MLTNTQIKIRKKNNFIRAVIGFFLSLIALIVLMACNGNKGQSISEKNGADRLYVLVVKCEDNNTVTVNIPEYTLINDYNNDHRKQAAEVMKIKRKWPLAMQSLKRSDFEAILSRNFVFKSTDSWYTREDYIRNRTTPDDWKIIHVDYKNMTVQFIGERVMITYINDVKNQNAVSGAIEMEHMSWVDVYIIENGGWKIESSHSMDYRVDKINTDSLDK